MFGIISSLNHSIQIKCYADILFIVANYLLLSAGYMFVNINKYHWNVYIYGTQGSPGHTIFWILNWHSRYDMNKLQCHLPNLLLKYRTTQLKSCSESPTQVVWCQVWNFPCRRCSVLYIWSLCGFVVSRDNANIGKYTSFILHKLAFLIGFQINEIHLF